MNCTLSRFYAMAAAALVLLAAAIIGAAIPLNLYGLGVAIAAVIAVNVLIGTMRDELRAYDLCMGPSTSCGSTANSVNLLGQAAAIISVVAFVVAFAIEIPAIAALASGIFAWIGVTAAAAAYALRVSGMVACGATILLLSGMLTNVKAYEDCRTRERAPTPPRKDGLTGDTTPVPVGTGTGTTHGI